MTEDWTSRQLDILRTVERLLGHSRAGRLTTASVAKELRASEAALYRHFPSKQAMLRGLLEYTELTFKRIVADEVRAKADPLTTCGNIMGNLMLFCQDNKGISRCLTREALHPDYYDLEDRVRELFDRLRLELRQQLADSSFNCEKALGAPPALACTVMTSAAEGVLAAWVREGMRDDLLRRWKPVWEYLRRTA